MMFQPKVRSFYTLTAINKRTGRRRSLTGECPNILLNVGKDRMGLDNWFAACHVGASSVPPVVTDQQLQAWRGGSSVVIADEWGAQQAPPYYGWRKKTFHIPGLDNQNLNEVGISFSSSDDPEMTTRSLLRNLAGDIVTITLLPDEVLEIQAEVRVYPPLTDAVGTVVANGITYDWIARAAFVTNTYWWGQFFGNEVGYLSTDAAHWAVYDNDLGDITTGPAGLQYNGGSLIFSNEAYQLNDYSRVITVNGGSNSWNATTGKLARSFRVGTTLGAYQIQFDSQVNPGFGIPKEVGQNLVMKYRIGWDQF